MLIFTPVTACAMLSFCAALYYCTYTVERSRYIRCCIVVSRQTLLAGAAGPDVEGLYQVLPDLITAPVILAIIPFEKQWAL